MLKAVMLDLMRVFRPPAGVDPKQTVVAGLAGHNKLHLGCGGNILPGWANIDMEGPTAALRWDLTQPLPMQTGTVTFIFNEHFIEHITRPQAVALLSECYRLLVPGGVLRISTPSLRKLIDEYLLNRTAEWSDYGWYPATPCQMLNEAMRLWGHQFLYDENELKSLLHACGFAEIVDVKWRESGRDELRNLECRPYHDEIILEAAKSGRATA